MNKEIVFILTSTVNTNSVKRVDEFVINGYKVHAYGFQRGLAVPNKSQYIDIGTVGCFNNNQPYVERLSILFKGIREVLRKTKDSRCLYYLVGLDVAMSFRLQSKNKYIFEEADMVHTNIQCSVIKNMYEVIDKSVIKHSVLAAFRSEGFIRYHFREQTPDNVCVIANRLNVNILDFDILPKKPLDLGHLKVGFVGFMRYKSIYNFAKVFCSSFPQNEFHFFGTFASDSAEKQFGKLLIFDNCYFHGAFKSPDELNDIYSQFDLVLSTYDVSSENVRYAEPNKLYEAIYFETPIIVSSDTYLADKVNRLGVGFAINAMNDQEIISFVKTLTSDKIQSAIDCTKGVDKKQVLNVNDAFFERIEQLTNSLK